jgi:hypothetical protein
MFLRRVPIGVTDYYSSFPAKRQAAEERSPSRYIDYPRDVGIDA